MLYCLTVKKFIVKNKKEEIAKILGVFEKESINLTKIESRPSKKGLGKYLFFVDFYGHRKDKTVQNILNELDGLTYFLKVLGSYPEF